MLRLALKLILIAVAVIVVTGLIMAGLGPAVGTVLLPLLVLGGMAIVGVVASTAGTTGRRVWTLLNTLEQTVRLNLPLPRMLRAMAASDYSSRDRLLKAVTALEQGEPLGVALESATRVPERITRILEAAERSGNLPQVLGRIVEQHRAALARHNPSLLFYRIYPLLLGMVYIAVATVFLVFVMPRFEQIFADFGTKLPPVTIALLKVTNAGGPLLLLLGVALFAGLIWTLYSAGRWRMISGFMEGTGGWIANRLPWIGRIRRERALGEVLDFSADGLDAGRSFADALADAAQITTNSALEAKIMSWIDEISHGNSIAESARIAGMPALVCGMLSTGMQTPDLAATLRFLGHYYATRFSRAIILLQASILPVVAIVMGGLVLWFLLSVIVPIGRLIDATIPYPIGL